MTLVAQYFDDLYQVGGEGLAAGAILPVGNLRSRSLDTGGRRDYIAGLIH